MATEADNLLSKVYDELKIVNASDEEKYKQLSAIVHCLQVKNDADPIHAKTTGTISERLCELALKARVPGIYKNLNDKWNWMADFSILGHPFNVLISVKSFKAKERLLVSGSGNTLSPTIGWGLMNDPTEWTEDRTRLYLYRSFIAIYIPSVLYEKIGEPSKSIHNINGNPFLRRLEDFMDDISGAVKDGTIDILAV